MKKGIAVIALLLVACVVLAACGEAVYIKSGNAQYEVQSVRIVKEIDDQAPKGGGNYLLIRVKGDGKNMDDMQDTLFNVETDKPAVSDGKNTVECEYITFGSSGDSNNAEVTATLRFVVPVEFAKQFTLSGEAFSPVQLTS